MENNLPLICPSCQTQLPANAYFCFNCGKKIKEPPQNTGILKQIGLYLLSILLPPLGLWPAVKYLKQEDQKSKIIGAVCVALTILSTILTLWATLGVINQAQQLMQTQLGGADLYLSLPGQK